MFLSLIFHHIHINHSAPLVLNEWETPEKKSSRFKILGHVPLSRHSLILYGLISPKCLFNISHHKPIMTSLIQIMSQSANLNTCFKIRDIQKKISFYRTIGEAL